MLNGSIKGFHLWIKKCNRAKFIFLKNYSEQQKKIDEISAIEIENAFLPIERVVFLVNLLFFKYSLIIFMKKAFVRRWKSIKSSRSSSKEM